MSQLVVLQKQRHTTLDSTCDAKNGQELIQAGMLSTAWQAVVLPKACCPAAACMQSGMMASRAGAGWPAAAWCQVPEAVEKAHAPVLVGRQQRSRVACTPLNQ